MFNATIKKMIARDGGERELFDSSYEEMQNFIAKEIRPEFDDCYILAVKFLSSTDKDMENAEETSWYLNPIYVKDHPEFLGLRMASELLPELLLIKPSSPSDDAFDLYEAFYIELMANGTASISDEEKYDKFVDYLENHFKKDS